MLIWGLITFLLSRNVSWRCEDAANYSEKGNQILPTYLTHPYIMTRNLGFLSFIKMFPAWLLRPKQFINWLFPCKKRTYDYVIINKTRK